MRIKIKWLIVVAISILSVLLLVHILFTNTQNEAKDQAQINAKAPAAYFTLENGTNISLSPYRGRTVLIYFVATWCSGCAYGTSILAQNIGFFNAHNITVLEIELYNDLGAAGPSIGNFIKDYAGNVSSEIIGGEASYNMTVAYDPSGSLEIYYLISSGAKTLYVNSPFATTLSSLENFISSNRL